MKSVRIAPNGPWVMVDVVCDCGRNGLQNKATKEVSANHMIELGAGKPDTILVCPCTKQYRIHPQRGHIHVENA